MTLEEAFLLPPQPATIAATAMTKTAKIIGLPLIPFRLFLRSCAAEPRARPAGRSPSGVPLPLFPRDACFGLRSSRAHPYWPISVGHVAPLFSLAGSSSRYL